MKVDDLPVGGEWKKESSAGKGPIGDYYQYSVLDGMRIDRSVELLKM